MAENFENFIDMQITAFQGFPRGIGIDDTVIILNRRFFILQILPFVRFDGFYSYDQIDMLEYAH